MLRVAKQDAKRCWVLMTFKSWSTTTYLIIAGGNLYFIKQLKSIKLNFIKQLKSILSDILSTIIIIIILLLFPGNT